nr:MAG TPA: hypothetical protein [Caudoviricetes sp.]
MPFLHDTQDIPVSFLIVTSHSVFYHTVLPSV